MSALSRERGAKEGTVALEFAMIGSIFIGLMILVFQLGFIFYAQTALDFAARQAARQMQTDQANPADQTSFKSAVFCPYLNGLLDCARVTLVLQPVTDYQAAMTGTPAAPFDSGATNGLMLLRATYTSALPLWPLTTTSIVGTAAYQNE
jgi:Flp pilus assembly protein TadG